MTVEAMSAQRREIAAVNRAFDGRLRVLVGIESNIMGSGELDLTVDELAGVELVLTAPHSRLRTTDDQTDRLLRVIADPLVHVLAHPRGRMSDSRAGLTADWDRVFAAAAMHHVAVEIDGDPARQDVDYELAHRAQQAGCLFAVDSDAHDELALVYAETALAHARLAGIPTSRVLNCWPLGDLPAVGRQSAPIRSSLELTRVRAPRRLAWILVRRLERFEIRRRFPYGQHRFHERAARRSAQGFVRRRKAADEGDSQAREESHQRAAARGARGAPRRD
jgi:histidinol phosphatase-like PHP family hydrolase